MKVKNFDDKILAAEIAVETDRMKKDKTIEFIKLNYQGKIKQRKDGRYYVYIDRKQYVALSEDELYEKLYEVLFKPKEWTMESIFPEFMRWKKDNSPVKGNTLKRNKYLWDKYFEDKDIVKIPFVKLTVKDYIRLFTDWTKKRELTAKAFNNNKSIINGFYNYAINELDIVNKNITKEIDVRQFPMKQVNNDGDVFSLEDRRRILDYLEDDDSGYASAIKFAFHVPIRIGELIALTWENVEGNRLRIKKQRTQKCEMNDDLTFTTRKYETVDQTKGFCEKGIRYVILSKKALKILSKINKDQGYIFTNKNGQPLTMETFNRKLESVCIKLGIKVHTSHKIRFCVASYYYHNGIPITQIQSFLGHSSVSTTMHYLRDVITDETTEKKISDLD